MKNIILVVLTSIILGILTSVYTISNREFSYLDHFNPNQNIVDLGFFYEYIDKNSLIIPVSHANKYANIESLNPKMLKRLGLDPDIFIIDSKIKIDNFLSTKKDDNTYIGYYSEMGINVCLLYDNKNLHMKVKEDEISNIDLFYFVHEVMHCKLNGANYTYFPLFEFKSKFGEENLIYYDDYEYTLNEIYADLSAIILLKKIRPEIDWVEFVSNERNDNLFLLDVCHYSTPFLDGYANETVVEKYIRTHAERLLPLNNLIKFKELKNPYNKKKNICNID